VHVFPDGVRTAQAAADGLGCPLGAIANSLIFDAAGSPVLILTSGAHRVDTAKVAAGLGLPSLARASAEFVRLHTGQAIGGVAPVGHPAQIPPTSIAPSRRTTRFGRPRATRTPCSTRPTTNCAS
jgi:prolyl-tRNA editing enzyme YbaK/EbsC (Cys-tRNA(Pro) deacylase)